MLVNKLKVKLTGMKDFFYKIVGCLICLFIINKFASSQEIKTHIFNLKNFGHVSIPIELDTLSQAIAKNALLENYLENADKAGITKVDKLYNINFGRSILENLDSATTVFWPKKSLLSLLNFDVLLKGDSSSIENEFSLIPSIILKRTKTKLHSAKFKIYLEENNKIEEFKDTIIDVFKNAIELILPSIKIVKFNSKYFNYKNEFPCFKISEYYTLVDSSLKTEYVQDIYSLFKGNWNYLFKFEYETNESEKWALYQDEFLRNLQISETAEDYCFRGNENLLGGKYKLAIQDFNRAIELDPYFTEAIHNRGLAKAELLDYVGAINDYNKVNKISPGLKKTFVNLGNAKFKLQDYEGAIADYSSAIEISQNDASVFHSRGFAKSKINDFQGALKDFDKAIELEPSLIQAFYNRAVVKGHLNDSKGAIQDYSRAIQLNPQFDSAYYNRGVEKGLQKNYLGAIQDFTKAIQLNSRVPNYFLNRGTIKYTMSEYSGALSDLNKAIELKPNFSDAFYNRGLVKIQLGDKKGGCSDFAKALNLGDDTVKRLIIKYCQ